MLIKHKDGVINLDLVTNFYKEEAFRSRLVEAPAITFCFNCVNAEKGRARVEIFFEDEEERDRGYEVILNC